MKVLVVEPPNQCWPKDTPRPNGALGPAYLVAALRAADIEADYYDGTVGFGFRTLDSSFYNRSVQENGLIRYGTSREGMAAVFAGYDVIALSSIFTAQTRMHFEAIRIAKEVGEACGQPIGIVAGGVNARALKKHFLAAGADVVIEGDGEYALVDFLKGIVRTNRTLIPLSAIPSPALHALPLQVYWHLGIPHAGRLPAGRRFGAIQTSRGCQDHCSFCHISTEKRFAGDMGYLREFTVNQVRRDVDNARALGINRLYFEDDNLFFNKKRLYTLAPYLKRPGLEYSNVNGANLRFLFNRASNTVDTEFIGMLADFGLCELMLPFESRSLAIMEQYSSAKYNPDAMDSGALVKALKAAGIRVQGNFMIGFPDESWDSVLRTRDFAEEMMSAGMDACGFMIPVPYPGSLDFERLAPEYHKAFDRDPLSFTDRMHWREKPIFPTLVPGEQLHEAASRFWFELNNPEYVQEKTKDVVNEKL